MRFRPLPAFFALVFLIVAGCAQRETDIGSTAITGLPGEHFTVTTDTATHGTDWRPSFTNGGGTSLEIGDAKSLYSFVAIRFEVRSGLPDSVIVSSLRIRLYRTGKVFPEFLPGLQVRIREIPDSVMWREGGLVPGSLPNRESFPIIDSTVASATDSFFVVDLSNPQDLWNHWRTGTDSTGGLLIEPRADVPGGTGGFIEYYSHQGPSATFPEVVPALLIHGQAFVNDTLLSPDTTVSTFATNDAYLVIDSTDVNPSTHAEHQKRLIVTQGMAQRAALYFPLDTLVRNFARAVNRAELHLYSDTSNALDIRYPDQNMVLKNGFITNRAWITNPDTLLAHGVPGQESIANGTWDGTSSELTFDVTTAVSSWVENPASNGGMQILAGEELDFLAREVFYGADADSLNKRPKLYIWFTESSYSSH